MSPDEIVDYVLKLNDQIFKRIVTNGQTWS
jgi:hypothetical protein